MAEEAARARWGHLLPPEEARADGTERAARGRAPFVTLTYAQSIDGSIASSRRIQLPLSGADALAMTHCLRSSHDAILVGVGTVLADNPKLTARIPVRWPFQPRPVIVDPRLEAPLDSFLLADAGAVRPWIFCHDDADAGRRRALEECGARVFPCARQRETAPSPPRLDLAEVLDRLGAAGVRSVMVEGGARIIGSFLRAPHLVDRLVVTIAPVYVGGFNVATGLVGPVHAVEVLPRDLPAASSPTVAGSFFHRLRDVRHDLLAGGDIVLSGKL